MSAPSHLDWCGDADCGDVSHKHAADAARSSELRRHADAAMAMLANASDLIDVPERPELHGWDIARLERIEAILRVNGLHEPSCASLQPVWLREPANAIPRRPCDCWLTKGKP